MPVTWFAHQAPVIGLKLLRPRWFDATALCVGSMVPDLLYSISAYVSIDTHKAPSAYTYGVPIGLALTVIVRWVLASVGSAQLPDLGQFRLRSFAVLSRRRPPFLITLTSMMIGIFSHISLDWFTHPGRPGVRLLRYDDVSVTLFGRTEPLASVFQLVGHVVGLLIAVLLLWEIGRKRLLDEWYGADQVELARQWTPSTPQRVMFWGAIGTGTIVGAIWGWPIDRVAHIERTFVGALGGAVLAATLIRLMPSSADGETAQVPDARNQTAEFAG
jgi:hypothetical protein